MRSDIDDWLRLLKSAVKSEIRVHEPMKLHTSFRIGGPADLFISPSSPEELVTVMEVARANSIPVTVIGSGTNLLVSDQGIEGLVVALGRGMAGWTVDGNKLDAEAGCRISMLARVTAERGLSGLEFAAGIPGTVGGAVAMNAGAFGGSICEVLERALVLTDSGFSWMDPSEMGFEYRKCRLLENGDSILVRAVFRLEKSSPDITLARYEENLRRRNESQPRGLPNAGSVFRNPVSGFAGELLDKAGCKGMREGDAAVSSKHANFIVNEGNATAAQVLSLMTSLQKKVLDRFGVKLEPEIRTVGRGMAGGEPLDGTSGDQRREASPG